MNKVWNILQAKGNHVWTISPKANVLDALKIMTEQGIGAVLVTQEENLLGIFSERDYARKVELKGLQAATTSVGEVMTGELITVSPHQSVNECMELMTEKRIRHLPVMDNGRLVGMISIGDVVKDIIEELQFMLKQMENFVYGLRQ